MVTNMNTRRAAHAWAMGLFLSFMTAASGCYIQHGGDAPWDDEAPPSVGICSDLCDHLQGCNLVEGEAWQACVDGCNAQHVSTPYLVETGAACVIDAGCAPLDTYVCPGAPLPPPPPSAPGWGSSGGGPASCTADCDCPSGDLCVEGACKTPCTASCECPTGESCEAGVCAPPPVPEISCQVDCDCPSGQVCDAGTCAIVP
jgi:Cys-rich repeat protein